DGRASVERQRIDVRLGTRPQIVERVRAGAFQTCRSKQGEQLARAGDVLVQDGVDVERFTGRRGAWSIHQLNRFTQSCVDSSSKQSMMPLCVAWIGTGRRSAAACR